MRSRTPRSSTARSGRACKTRVPLVFRETDAHICSPGYIAGVTNPIFETAGSWDLLCDIGTNRIVVSKDIHLNHPASWSSSNPLIMRTGTVKAEGSIGSEEEAVRVPTKEGGSTQKPEFAGRPDSADNVFIEDVSSLFARPFSAHKRYTGPRRDFFALLGGARPREVHRVRDTLRARCRTL